MEYSFKLIHWNSFDCFLWNSYEILMNSYKIRKRSARAARKIFTYTIGVFIILLLKFEWRSCTLFVLLVMILLQKFLPTRNILARAAQKILNISTIFHNFTKKFSMNWRAQRGKFFEYIIVLSGFFFRNSILILNKLARAARKIFSYIISNSKQIGARSAENF